MRLQYLNKNKNNWGLKVEKKNTYLTCSILAKNPKMLRKVESTEIIAYKENVRGGRLLCESLHTVKIIMVLGTPTQLEN